MTEQLEILKKRDLYSALRRKKKITLKEISESIGIGISSLSEFERGIIYLKEHNAQKYFKYIEQHDNRKDY